MNKETLIQHLEQKVGKNDFQVLSSQTVDGIVTPLLPMFSDDATITDATYELPVQLLKNYVGQYRRDVAAGISSGIEEEKTRLTSEKDAAIASFKAQWEKDHPSAGAGVNPPAEKPQGAPGSVLSDEDLSKKVDALFAAKLEELTGKDGAIGKLTGLLETFESERKADRINAITQAIESHITEKEGGDLTHEQSRALHYALKDFTIDEKVSLDDLKKNFESVYEATYKDLYPSGGMPFSNAFGDGDDSNVAFEDFIKRRGEAAKQAALEQEALKKKFV